MITFMTTGLQELLMRKAAECGSNRSAARLLDVDAGQLGQWIKGSEVPSFKAAEKMAPHLGISQAEMIQLILTAKTARDIARLDTTTQADQITRLETLVALLLSERAGEKADLADPASVDSYLNSIITAL